VPLAHSRQHTRTRGIVHKQRQTGRGLAHTVELHGSVQPDTHIHTNIHTNILTYMVTQSIHTFSMTSSTSDWVQLSMGVGAAATRPYTSTMDSLGRLRDCVMWCGVV
jgi:hypothetical protein